MAAIVEFETMPELFSRLVALHEGHSRVALAFKDKKTKEWKDISWEEFRDRVNAMAGYLYHKGVRPGDRVAILSENRPEWAFADQATQMLGAVNVSLYTSLPASQVAYILQDSGAKLFIVSTGIQLRKAKEVFDDCPDLLEVITMSELRGEHPDYVKPWDDAMKAGEGLWEKHAEEITTLRDAVKPEDLCALIYTSGTTGKPKGVMLTHHNLASNTNAALEIVPFGETDHHLSFLPLCHSFERTAGYTAVMACGAKITYAESIDAVSKNLGEVSPTVLIAVPRLFEKMYNLIAKSVDEGSPMKKRIFDWSVRTGKKAAEKKFKNGRVGPFLRMQQALGHKLVFAKLHEKLGGRLRFAVSGGAALPAAIGEFFQAAGIQIIEGYGLTETSPILTISPIKQPRYGSVGFAIPGVTVAIQSLADGQIVGQLSGHEYPSTLTTDAGEIVAKGPNIMKGYWNNDSATQEAIDSDGWYHTGDVGRFDNGYLLITDRIKHMIVSRGGKNIYPGPIEEQFTTMPAIDQMIVIGEGRDYLTALVVPNLDVVKKAARDSGIPYNDEANLLAEESIQKIFDQGFRSYSKKAAAHEKIRGFRLIQEPFTVENGMMTPTMKLKRKEIEKNYSDLIEEMYGVFA